MALADTHKYYAIFQQFEHFTNYINFAIEFLVPEIWVDNEAQPTLACFHSAPAYFLWGDPNARDVTPMLEMLPADSWLVPCNDKWDRRLTAYFGEKLISYPCTSFDAASLNLAHLRSLKAELLQYIPPGTSTIALHFFSCQRFPVKVIQSQPRAVGEKADPKSSQLSGEVT